MRATGCCHGAREEPWGLNEGQFLLQWVVVEELSGERGVSTMESWVVTTGSLRLESVGSAEKPHGQEAAALGAPKSQPTAPRCRSKLPEQDG